MLVWMVCAMVPGVGLCIAGLLAEQATHQRHLPSRWVWIAAMSLSIMLPIAGPSLLGVAPARLPLPSLPLSGGSRGPVLQPLDAWGPGLWLALSIVTLLVLVLSASLVQRRSRTWRRTTLGKLEVYLAREAGPAVFGWWQPRIVLPEWLSQAPARQRELAIAHEQAHILARDPQLLGCALLMVSIMPWNLPLWWQLRRLRCAMEVDCDQRVLRAGGDLVDYGETLIHLSQHQSRMGGLMAATSEPRSFLERRIQIMSSEMSRFSRLAAAAWMCLAVGTAVVAAEVTSPPTSAHGQASQAPVRDLVAAGAAKVEAEQGPEAAVEAEGAVEAEDADAVVEAEDAEKEASEAMHDADEQMAEANEAMRDAEEQKAEATAAKHEAEAAAMEARAKRQAAEAAAHAPHPGVDTPH